MIPQKREKHLQTLIRRLNINLTNLEQLSIALTHPSFLLEEEGSHALINNQRLEFLGDAVVDLIVGQFLYETFPDKPEGELTKMRAALVCESSLANAARRVSLGEYLLLGKGEEATGGRFRESITSDVMEALIGALYLDGGYEVARNFIYKNILSDIENRILFYDSKTVLQEIIQTKPNQKLVYELIDEIGPDHNKKFIVEAILNGEKVGFGEGKTKKAAEQKAAYEAILAIRKSEVSN